MVEIWRGKQGEPEKERKAESDVEELAAQSIYMNPTGKALQRLPAIVSTVYQMAFQGGQEVQVQTKPNKQENK